MIVSSVLLKLSTVPSLPPLTQFGVVGVLGAGRCGEGAAPRLPWRVGGRAADGQSRRDHRGEGAGGSPDRYWSAGPHLGHRRQDLRDPHCRLKELGAGGYDKGAKQAGGLFIYL